MPKLLGGQIRTIVCKEPDCGWSCRKQLQEANKLEKLHNRLTHKKGTAPPAEFCKTQGIQGHTSTKHGNPIYIPMLTELK